MALSLDQNNPLIKTPYNYQEGQVAKPIVPTQGKFHKQMKNIYREAAGNKAKYHQINKTKKYLESRKVKSYKSFFISEFCSSSLLAYKSKKNDDDLLGDLRPSKNDDYLLRNLKPSQSNEKLYNKLNQLVTQCSKNISNYLNTTLPAQKRLNRFKMFEQNQDIKNMLFAIERCKMLYHRDSKKQVSMMPSLNISLKQLKQKLYIMNHNDCRKLNVFNDYNKNKL
ncbi:MAG: hypothetical protein ACR2M7_02740 [Bdellovibrionales bacterium]